MRTSQSKILLPLLLLLFVAPCVSASLLLEGDFTQGGLLNGRVTPGAKVALNGDAVRISEQGIFLIGFGRDEALINHLKVTNPDGSVERRKIELVKRQYDIQRVDGLPPSKVTPPKHNWKRINAEGKQVKQARMRDDKRTDFLNGFKWPAIGRISGVYGSQRVLNGKPRRPHFGVDVAGPVGTQVVAPAGGLVTLVHSDMFYSGGTLIVDHGHGLSSSFLHLSKILVKQGDWVKQGEPIAEIGATGRVSGPHLDWRINLFKKRLDPALLVGPMSSEEKRP
ncbi:MAG: M23 family metallopeptidase [Candidatus Polarisedimenticolaceae bacterium]|nr:M23 family metallopeptidase [Candidatus Polarisedimenticolaceae bacterium]